MALGETVLQQPITGWWQWAGHPEVIRVHGRQFRRANWKQDYPDVVEQYRETTPQNSMHLKVLANGTYVIDHIDEDNPDMGRPVPHFFNDHPLGRFLKGAAIAGGLVGGLTMCVVGLVKVFEDE
jgi:hypothetical protein